MTEEPSYRQRLLDRMVVAQAELVIAVEAMRMNTEWILEQYPILRDMPPWP